MTKVSDLSDATCIENLRPKTVPEQLVALGTVSQVSDIQVRLQITGGVVCLVDRYNVSQPYTKSLKEYEADYKRGKQPLTEPPRLGELFKKGEQYVCKVIDRQTRKGYADAQDIIATVDPEQIQEDNIPTTLLTIPNIPLQGAIISIEDHGYRVEIGFKNITGFLKFEECEDYCVNRRNGEKFCLGQIVRCCTSEVLEAGSESRVIQLSLRKEILKASKFSKEKCGHHALTPKYILPGSSGYMTVMKVQRDGLIVNFLDEFAGFVGLSHLEQDWQDPRKSYKISDTRKCTVLYYNSATNTFALTLKSQRAIRKTIKQLLGNYHIGQIIKEAEVVFLNGLKSVNFKIGNSRAVANVRDALDEDVTTMNKDELHLALDAAFPDGSKHKARIKSINYADLMLVLNLRQEFLELSCVSVDELEPADFLEVHVKKYVRDGIVVTFGLNLRAIILNCHLKDYISAKSYKRYPIGMPLKCRVLKIDPDKHPTRVYLTNKEQLMDPEMTIIDAYDKSFRGETVNAIVVKLKTDGLIVELFNNVKGFIPLRFCSNAKIRAVTDLFEVGQVVTCTAYRIEPSRQTLSLSIVPYEKVVELMKEKAKQKRDKLKESNRIDFKIEKVEIAARANKQSKKRKSQTDNENRSKKSKLQHGDENNVVTKDQSDVENEENGESEHGEEEGDEEANYSVGDHQEQPLEEPKKQKSRLERSREAKEREEKIREVERKLLDTNRPAQSVGDFEKLVIKTPNAADVWIKYSKFFLDNIETEKARIVCRRALKTINFRMEKEKLKVWLHMIMIEAKFGGLEKLRELVEEAAQTNDKLELYRRASKVLVSCGELDEAERMYDQLLHKLGGKRLPDAWLDYVVFLMERRKDLAKARGVFETAVKSFAQQKQHLDAIHFRSRFAHLEFRFGDVERGKTLFENLLSEHPKRMDLWSVYEGAIRKFGTRQLDSEEVRQQNEQILERIASLQK